MLNHVPISESLMQEADARIPELAPQAGRAAYERALTLGVSLVMKSPEGQLIERFPDGSVVVLRDLPAGQQVQAGVVLHRKANCPIDGFIR